MYYGIYGMQVVGFTTIIALLIVFLTGSVSPADAGMALAFAVQVRKREEMKLKMGGVSADVGHLPIRRAYTDRVGGEDDER